MVNIFRNCILELTSAGAASGNAFLQDEFGIKRFTIPSPASVGTVVLTAGPGYSLLPGFYDSKVQPTYLGAGGVPTATSVQVSFNVYTIHADTSDRSLPAVGGSIPVVYLSALSAGNALVARDNWVRYQ